MQFFIICNYTNTRTLVFVVPFPSRAIYSFPCIRVPISGPKAAFRQVGQMPPSKGLQMVTQVTSIRAHRVLVKDKKAKDHLPFSHRKFQVLATQFEGRVDRRNGYQCERWALTDGPDTCTGSALIDLKPESLWVLNYYIRSCP